MKNASPLRRKSTLKRRVGLGGAKAAITPKKVRKGLPQNKTKKERKVKQGVLKKKLWKMVSEYIRRKENGVCFTCGLTKDYRAMQAGHFLPKSLGSALYFEENNIHCQCFRCNINLGGNGAVYYHRMVARFGQEEVNRLLALKSTIVKLDYPPLIEEWSEKLKNL